MIMELIYLVLGLVYLMLPAYVANMAPVFARGHFQFLNKPLDFGLTFRKKRVLGDNKTFRGLLVGVSLGTLVGIGQGLLPLALFPSVIMNSTWQWAFLISLGALLGDAVKSFFKRQCGVAPGTPWVPFDQIDYTIGALALGSVLYLPLWYEVIILIITNGTLHILVNFIGSKIGMRDSLWG
jgi:CDP-2,3-bis-(O-geranylgeranyl)-sn-glycerol synthase